MARTGITFEQVAAAAQALKDTGSAPTIKAVRDALGGGSPNTIQRHLMTWRGERAEAVATSALPDSLAAAIAAELARARAEVRAELAELMQQAQAEAAELAAAGEALEAEIAELKLQISTLTTERDIARGTTAHASVQIAGLKADLQAEKEARTKADISAAVAVAKLESATERAVKAEAETQDLREKVKVSSREVKTAVKKAASGS